MSKLAHTAGPWFWLAQGKHDAALLANHGHRPVVLFVHKGQQCGPAGLLRPFDLASPDMHLLAAAPSLLTACQAALGYLDSTEQPGAVADLLRAAIANAEGRST